MAEETKKDEKKPKAGEKKSPKSTASSESQRKLAGLALAVKKGNVDDAEVTSNVRDMAADMSTSDLRAMASKPGGKKKLPDKVTPEKKKDKNMNERHMMDPHDFYADRPEGESPEETERAYADYQASAADDAYDTHRDAELMRGVEGESVASGFGDDPEEMEMRDGESDFYTTEQPHNLNFYDIIGKYNEYGQMLHRDHSMQELAQQLSDIAEAAEMHLTSEANDWYDSHTISRNIKEMQGYAKEFGKLAQEADEYNIRMEALYEDMGRVLERYFEIYPQNEDAQENSPQPQMHQVNPLAVTQKEFPHERQAKSFTTPHIEEAVTARAVIIARSKLCKEDKEKFDRLPIVRKVLASWKILSENAK